MRQTIITVISLVILCSSSSTAASRDALWRDVDAALAKGLPQTAISLLEQIIPGAIADEAHAEGVKALCLKIVQEGDIQGGKAEEMIVRLEAALTEVPEAMHPMMEGILGHWYWLYFQQNSWRYMQRTQTSASPGEDISTWDLPRILAEIDEHFTKSLAAAEELKAIPVREYDDFLERGNAPDSYRPTLHDFLAHEALSFYTAGEQAGTQPQDKFEFMADSPIFDTVEAFLAWEPETTDQDSAKLKAIHLYQDLLATHRVDGDQSAFIDVDLTRLAFGKNHALGPEKTERFDLALERFIEEHEGHPIAARARHAWAASLHAQGEFLAAHALAQATWDRYPATVGGGRCYNLVGTIEQSSAAIKTERVWNAPWPDIQVTYRNVTELHFRAYAVDFEDYPEPTSGGIYLNDTEAAALLAREPVQRWSAELPPTDDYQTRTESLPAPQDLDRGFYLVVASHRPGFKLNDNQLSIVPVWVSDLALVIRDHYYEPVVEGLVLHAVSGEALAGVKVTRWLRSDGHYRVKDSVTSQQDGRFVFDDDNHGYSLLLAETEDDRLASAHAYTTGHGSGPTQVSEQTVFFTDRAIYRPGQTLRYKGVCIHLDRRKNDYRTLSGERITVVFRDANGQEIASRSRLCNDFGSFSGSFTAPSDRLMGQMSLYVQDGPSGYAAVRVEEYKRPTFQVALAAPSEAPKLDEEVSVPGLATAYTGAAVGGAEVAWRVTRVVQLPRWCRRGWFGYPSQPAEQAIAHGTTVTRADGSFSVSFTAKPDLSILPEHEPVFTYRIHADVTDTAGETRSSESTLRAGYTALRADLEAESWQSADTPVVLSLVTTSLDGQGEAVPCTLLMYRLQEPEGVVRRDLITNSEMPDLSDPENWPLGEMLTEHAIHTNTLGHATLSLTLRAGLYRAVLQTADRFGTPVTAEQTLHVLDPERATLDTPIPNIVAAPSWSVQPGETFTAVWGTGYEKGRAYIELECRQEVLRAWWTDPGRTQELIGLDVTEDMRGGFTLRVTQVRENRSYITERIVDVPWTHKQLTLRWERFRSLLEPGTPETWTAVITGPDARAAVAEMVAALYDASLDAFFPHDWIHSFSGFRRESLRLGSVFENQALAFRILEQFPWFSSKKAVLSYRHYPAFIRSVYFYDGPQYSGGGGRARGGDADESVDTDKQADTPAPGPEPETDLSDIVPRRNLDETAFFFPHLVSDHDGEVRIEFTAPEALTEWRFLGFAHDHALRSGYLTDTTVTAKDLMVQPNAPRFVREGDTLEFTVKVTNQSAARQTGQVALHLADARTGASRDETVANLNPQQTFDVPSMESRTYAWRLRIPDGCDYLTYKAVGGTDRLSDGEEGFLPVLSRRILVTESLPLPIRGPQTKEFEFAKLLQSGDSESLRHQSLTVQMVSQPAWYAVMALPYLMEQTRESSIATFTRFYANSLGAYIANSDPQIKNIFAQWRATPALDSPLEKNEDLKSVILEETPWLRQARRESQARRNVGILFDDNRLTDEMSRAQFKLVQMQYDSGLWPWYPGARGNEYLTLNVVTGFGRLRHLGVNGLDMGPAVKALNALDAWMDRSYRKYQPEMSPLAAYYLYGRSFFLNDQAVAPAYQEALDYWLAKARSQWLQQPRQSQAHLALALRRFGDLDTPQDIMRSIKEFSVMDEELGMTWRDTERSWWWYRAPIETQALMIEAFDEVMADAQAVEDCRVWLLKQKQTQNWKTNRATADAIYGLLLRGGNLLGSHALVEVALGGEWIEPEDVEAGTGFYEKRFTRNEIQPAMGEITVRKVDEGVSWGSAHWQFLEDVAKVTPYEGTPLQLQKALYVKRNTAEGPTLFPVEGPLAVGDELVVRLELRVDRDMEYVHLKDQRGSGTEPVNVLSRYRFQDGLGYYESTRDTASHFYMDYLPKGVYVFEYSTRVQHRGEYQSGIATIQCLYAPEFNSHSESFDLVVR